MGEADTVISELLDVGDIADVAVDSYVASVLADYLRQTAIRDRKSLSFETVMSSPDKVDLLAAARAAG